MRARVMSESLVTPLTEWSVREGMGEGRSRDLLFDVSASALMQLARERSDLLMLAPSTSRLPGMRHV